MLLNVAISGVKNVVVTASDDGRVVGTAFATANALYFSAVDFSLPFSSLSLPNSSWPLNWVISAPTTKIRLVFDESRYGIEPFPFVATLMPSAGRVSLVRYSASVTAVVEMAVFDGLVDALGFGAQLQSDGRNLLVTIANASHSAQYSIDLASPSPSPELRYLAALATVHSPGETVNVVMSGNQSYCIDSITDLNSTFAYFYAVECVWPALNKSAIVATGLRTAYLETVRTRRLNFLTNGLLCVVVSSKKNNNPEPFFFARCIAPLDYADGPITISLNNSNSVGVGSPPVGAFSARAVAKNSSVVCATAVFASGSNDSMVMHSCGPGMPPSENLSSYSLILNSTNISNSDSIIDSTGSWYAHSFAMMSSIESNVGFDFLLL